MVEEKKEKIEKSFKIVELRAENFQRIKAVTIKPDGSTVLITGRNEQGKSSVLDSIMAALCGKKYCPEKPIRKGQEKAKVTVDMGEFKVIRTFTGKTDTVKVVRSDGFEAKSPQKMLNSIVGQIAFDPMLFVTQKARDQRETLMKMAGLDFGDIDEKIAAIKESRTAENADIKRLGVALDTLSTLDFTDVPDIEVSMTDLTTALSEALAHNTQYQANVARRRDKAQECGRTGDRVTAAQEAVGRLTQQLAAADAALVKEQNLRGTQRAELEKMEQLQLVPTETIQADIESLEDTNQHVRVKLNYAKITTELETHKAAFSQLGQDTKDVEAEKMDRLAKAVFPLDGLSVDETGVLFEGIPLAQVNDAKKLEIGVAVSMKLNPKLRVIRLKGNDFDTASMAVVEKMVADGGYQIWIEKVTDGQDVGFVIEDGMLAGAEEDPLGIELPKDAPEPTEDEQTTTTAPAPVKIEVSETVTIDKPGTTIVGHQDGSVTGLPVAQPKPGQQGSFFPDEDKPVDENPDNF